jgi:hypothetical protein
MSNIRNVYRSDGGLSLLGLFLYQIITKENLPPDSELVSRLAGARQQSLLMPQRRRLWNCY